MSVVGLVHADWIGLNTSITIHRVCKVNCFVCSVRVQRSPGYKIPPRSKLRQVSRGGQPNSIPDAFNEPAADPAD